MWYVKLIFRNYRRIMSAPWYVRKENMHVGLGILLFKLGAEMSRVKYLIKLKNRPNP